MSDVLARRYRSILRVYPSSYRLRWGDELLGTLLEEAAPEQRWPNARQTASIAVEGVRARLEANRQRPPRAVWLDGLRVAVLLILAQAFAQMAPVLVRAGTHYGGMPAHWSDVTVPEGSAMLLLALLSIVVVWRGRWFAALPPVVGWLAVQIHSGAEVSAFLVTALFMLVFLAVWERPSHPTRPALSAWWLLVVPLVVALRVTPELLTDGSAQRYPYHQVTAVILALACGAGALLDSRLAIVAACVVAAETVQTTVMGPMLSDSHTTVVALNVGHQTWLTEMTPALAANNPFSGVIIDFTVDWWTPVLGIGVLVLFLVGHLKARQQATP